MATRSLVHSRRNPAELWASVIGGGLLAAYGIRRRDRLGTLLAIVGGGLALRGIENSAAIDEWLGVRKFAGPGSDANALRGRGIRVERTITIQRPLDEVYRFWRELENLPRFMEHLVEVRPIGGDRYRWVAKAPIGTVKWDAEIIDEQVPWHLAWRSVAGSQIRNAGSVRFTPAVDGRGTEVNVMLAYKPPAGILGAVIARMLGEEPGVQVREDLRRFKQIMETGEIATADVHAEGRT